MPVNQKVTLSVSLIVHIQCGKNDQGPTETPVRQWWDEGLTSVSLGLAGDEGAEAEGF